MIDSLLRTASGLDPALLYVVIGAAVALESAAMAGIVVPGELTLLFSGYLAGESLLGLAVLIPVAAGAAVAGDAAGWLFGRYLLQRSMPARVKRIMTDERLARVRAALNRRSTPVVGRFVGPVRTLLPAAAGTAGSPYRKVFVYSVISAAVWVPTIVTVGLIAGHSFRAWGNALSYAALAGFGVYLVTKRLRRRQTGGAQAAAAPVDKTVSPACPDPACH